VTIDDPNSDEERGKGVIGASWLGRWIRWKNLPSRLHEFDIVIVSTRRSETTILRP